MEPQFDKSSSLYSLLSDYLLLPACYPSYPFTLAAWNHLQIESLYLNPWLRLCFMGKSDRHLQLISNIFLSLISLQWYFFCHNLYFQISSLTHLYYFSHTTHITVHLEHSPRLPCLPIFVALQFTAKALPLPPCFSKESRWLPLHAATNGFIFYVLITLTSKKIWTYLIHLVPTSCQI